ncbi:MAG: prolipoprotein diacylglyceryl transferase family protein [Bacteroidota bacterium]
MYPRVSDFVNDIFGTDWVWPVQTFGFFLGLLFIIGFYIARYELKRKEQEGIFKITQKTISLGGPISLQSVLINIILMSLLGYKLGLWIEDYDLHVRNPQAAMFSLTGSWTWALIIGGLTTAYQVWTWNKLKDTEAKRRTVNWGIADELATIFTIAFIAGILGSKIFHNLEYWDDFIADPVGSLLSFSGLTFYGGLICAGIGIGYYVVKKGYPLLPFADVAAPVLMLGYGIGRIGCQTSGDGDWGIINTAPKPEWMSFLPDWAWAYNYPHNVLNQGVPIPGCEGDFCSQLLDPVFPTPIYETVLSVLIFAFLWSIRKKLPYWGQLSGIYLFFNGLERFWIEKIRVNSTYNIGGYEITQAEIISSILMISGVILFILTTYVWKLNQQNPKLSSRKEAGDG